MARKPTNPPPNAAPGEPPAGPDAGGDDVAPPADVPVTAVVLYSSGVGYFEHAGTVDGDGRTELRFKADQINDVLKSLVLQDVGGRVGRVIYPSQDPVEKALKSFGVDITENPSLAQLLNQLRGARITVHLPTDRVGGTVLGVEQRRRPLPDKGFIDAWLLNLVTPAGIRSVALDDVQRLELEEPDLQDELNRALATLAGARAQDKKPVMIHFHGQGERAVRLGYVVEAPVWKTSYRLILPEEPVASGKTAAAAGRRARLQGWAIVENQTDNDWTDVQLTLVSGRPISFVQNLYQPLYIPRPRVEPELYTSLRPPVYEGGMVMAMAEMAAPAPPQAPAAAAPVMRRMRAAAAGGVSADASLIGRGGFAGGDDPSVASVADARQIGELFQYTVPGVSLPRQRSAMIPIVVDDTDAERVSIYNEQTLARHPLNGVRLKNTTGKHLLQGPITVLEEGAYAGDARIDHVPPGQQRLLSYGIDLQVLANPKRESSDQLVQGASIAKGVLRVTLKAVYTRTFVFENKGERDKTIVVEHPVRAGAKLVDTPDPAETTADLYRFDLKAPAGKTARITVKQEQTIRQELQLMTDSQWARLGAFSYGGDLPPPVAAALAEARRRREALADVQRQIEERRAQLQEVTQEQSRLRDNLKTAPEKSQYQSRLLNKLNEQETKIETVQGEIEALQRTQQERRTELEAYLSELDVG